MRKIQIAREYSYSQKDLQKSSGKVIKIAASFSH